MVTKRESKDSSKNVFTRMFNPTNYPKNNILSVPNFEKLFSKKNLTLGQRAADLLTKWAGSWFFILFFLSFMIFWMMINVYFLINLGNKPFDPYPFILLNLVLSCLALSHTKSCKDHR